MTTIADRKTRLAFIAADEVKYRGRFRRIVIEVHRDGYSADVRLEGTKVRFPFSFAGLYAHAAKIQADKQIAAKKAAKKSSK